MWWRFSQVWGAARTDKADESGPLDSPPAPSTPPWRLIDRPADDQTRVLNATHAILSRCQNIDADDNDDKAATREQALEALISDKLNKLSVCSTANGSHLPSDCGIKKAAKKEHHDDRPRTPTSRTSELFSACTRGREKINKNFQRCVSSSCKVFSLVLAFCASHLVDERASSHWPATWLVQI